MSDMPSVTSYDTIWLAARSAPMRLNLLSLDQPAIAAPMIPCPDMANTNRMPTPSGATTRSIGK